MFLLNLEAFNNVFFLRVNRRRGCYYILFLLLILNEILKYKVN